MISDEIVMYLLRKIRKSEEDPDFHELSDKIWSRYSQRFSPHMLERVYTKYKDDEKFAEKDV